VALSPSPLSAARPSWPLMFSSSSSCLPYTGEREWGGDGHTRGQAGRKGDRRLSSASFLANIPARKRAARIRRVDTRSREGVRGNAIVTGGGRGGREKTVATKPFHSIPPVEAAGKCALATPKGRKQLRVPSATHTPITGRRRAAALLLPHITRSLAGQKSKKGRRRGTPLEGKGHGLRATTASAGAGAGARGDTREKGESLLICPLPPATMASFLLRSFHHLLLLLFWGKEKGAHKHAVVVGSRER